MAFNADATRIRLVSHALWLETLTATWMAIEAAVSIGSGVLAGNLSLVAFGADSVIELASAVVLLWRLRIELQQGAGFPETVEEWARKIAQGLLFALAAYVVASAGYGLGDMKVRNFQHQGLIVTASAIPAIYLLAKAKITVANRIGSRALRADAVESIACAYLAAVVLIGPLGEWSSDSITSLAIVVFLVKDGREAWIGDDAEDGLADHRSSKVGGGWLRRRYQ